MKKFQEWLSTPQATDSIKKNFGLLNNLLPEYTKESKIIRLDVNKNPILMQLADHTQLYFTLDQFKRIKGRPEIGKTVKVTFQRLEGDTSASPSKINYIEIL